ncbi:MAG: hypothetical protein CL867_03925 [Cytophagaceae bacterium]|nr:hypothetical protein [Cytophagaceae bacterium]
MGRLRYFKKIVIAIALTVNLFVLAANRDNLKQYIPEEALPYYIESKQETAIHFPVLSFPTKLKTLNLDKTPAFEGVLKGIKGQYLIFDNDTVFNVRSWEGYVVRLTLT